MELINRIEALAALGTALNNVSDEELDTLCSQVRGDNAWFQPIDTQRALHAIVQMLKKDTLQDWISRYPSLDKVTTKKVGLIMAGNIPAVGFHDWLTVLLAGSHAFIKLSSQDRVLLPFIQSVLSDVAPSLAKNATFVSKLSLDELDVVIATGSDNSSRYFERYFQKMPYIIRKNRTSIAVLTGSETEGDLKELAKDVLWYYGLGCRNVSKLYIPKGYDLPKLLDAFEEMKEYCVYQHKYVNNYDYNKSIYLVNGVEHFDNGFLLLKKSEELVSPISVLYFEEYDVDKKFMWDKEKVQCIVGGSYVPFGKAQSPAPWDYADGVDTFDFLTS